VLGWASSPEPAEPSLFKPKPSWALLRACNGLGLASDIRSPNLGSSPALIHCSLACRSSIGKVKYYCVVKI